MNRVIETIRDTLTTAFDAAFQAVVRLRRDRQSRDERLADVPLDSEQVETLTYRDAITWLTKNRPNDQRIAKAAVLRELVEGSLRVTTVFLDQDGEVLRDKDNIPYGRTQVVTRLDQELMEFFGDREMVLFE